MLHISYVFVSHEVDGEVGDLYYHDNNGLADLVEEDLRVEWTEGRARRHFKTRVEWEGCGVAAFHFVNGLVIRDEEVAA